MNDFDYVFNYLGLSLFITEGRALGLEINLGHYEYDMRAHKYYNRPGNFNRPKYDSLLIWLIWMGTYG
jgi:hypothetical protein